MGIIIDWLLGKKPKQCTCKTNKSKNMTFSKDILDKVGETCNINTADRGFSMFSKEEGEQFMKLVSMWSKSSYRAREKFKDYVNTKAPSYNNPSIH